MELDKEGQLIMEVRRLFAHGSVFGHSKVSTIDEFETAILNDASAAQLESIAQQDAGLSTLLIKLGNKTVKNTQNQLHAISLRAAINRVGLDGCRAALLSYKFEVLFRNDDQAWIGIFESALERTHRAASIAKAICSRLQQPDKAQVAIMISVLYATSIFAKIMAAQSLEFTKDSEILDMVKYPSSTLAEPVLMANKIPYGIIQLVCDMDSATHQSLEGQIAKSAWVKVMPELKSGAGGEQH